MGEKGGKGKGSGGGEGGGLGRGAEGPMLNRRAGEPLPRRRQWLELRGACGSERPRQTLREGRRRRAPSRRPWTQRWKPGEEAEEKFP